MITDPRTETWGPVVYMNMLDLRSSLFNRLRDKDMIQLLRVLVKDISVSLHGVETRDFVEFTENVSERCEHGTSLCEFVEVTGYDDVRIRVEVEERFNESLPVIKN